MEKSLGLIEVRGLSSAIAVADSMVKAADVVLLELEAARGNGMMTIKVNGNVGAVRASIEAGKAKALFYNAFVSSDIIARPHGSLDDCFRIFAGETGQTNVCTDVKKKTVVEQKAKMPLKRTIKRTRRTRKKQPVIEVKERVTFNLDGPEEVSSHQDIVKIKESDVPD